MSAKNLLIIRFSSIGDIVLQTGLIGSLKEKWGEDLRITFVTSKEYACLIQNHPWIDEVIAFDKSQSLNEFVDNLKTKNFDFILDLHSTHRSRVIRMKLWKIPTLIVDKRTLERKILVGLKLNLFKIFNDQLPQAKRLVKDFKEFMSLKSFKANKVGVEKLEEKDIISIVPTASFLPKRWPINSFYSLTEKLLADEKLKNYDIQILAGPQDNFCEVFSSLEEKYPNRCFNLQGKTTLEQSVQKISQSKLVIGNDTGMNHIAEAFNIKVLTIFGPTHSSFGFRPILDNSKYLEANVWCRPCGTKGSRQCFRSKHFCMENITVDDVYNETKELLRVC